MLTEIMMVIMGTKDAEQGLLVYPTVVDRPPVSTIICTETNVIPGVHCGLEASDFHRSPRPNWLPQTGNTGSWIMVDPYS